MSVNIILIFLQEKCDSNDAKYSMTVDIAHCSGVDRLLLHRGDDGADAPCGNERGHDSHEWLEDGVAAHGPHHAHGTEPAGDEENDDGGEDCEDLECNPRRAIRDECGSGEGGGDADPTGDDGVLALVAVHPGSVGPLVAGGECGRRADDEQCAESRWNEWHDDGALRHVSVLTEPTE